MARWPRTCSCDRCYQLDPASPWEDSEHPRSTAPLNFCPQCGQQLPDNPTHTAQPREELHYDRP